MLKEWPKLHTATLSGCMELTKKILGSRSGSAYVELDDPTDLIAAKVPMGIAICGALPSPATPVPTMAIAVCSGAAPSTPEARGLSSGGPIAQLAMEPDGGQPEALALNPPARWSSALDAFSLGSTRRESPQPCVAPVGSVVGGVLAPDLVPAGLIWDKELVKGLCHSDDDVRYEAALTLGEKIVAAYPSRPFNAYARFLADFVSSGDSRLQIVGVEILRTMGETALPFAFHVANLLHRKDPAIRIEAVRFLAQVRLHTASHSGADTCSIDSLWRAARYWREGVRTRGRKASRRARRGRGRGRG